MHVLEILAKILRGMHIHTSKMDARLDLRSVDSGNCDTTFRRIVDVSDNNTSQDDETRHPAWSSKDQTEQDQPSNNINRKHEFQMRDFQRVRIIYSTNESSVGLWCDVCKKNRALPYDVHQSFRDGGKSICWSCLNELNLSDASGMTSSENRDSGDARRSRRLYFERNTGKARPFSDLSDSVPSYAASYEPEFSSSRPFDELEQGTHPKAKTLVCRFWQEGKCKKGDDCTFIHKS